MGKLIIISAPSGTGKSTLITRLMSEPPELQLRFSVSATSRAPRGAERDGVEYHFFSPEEFEQRIARGEFLEYEEVYSGRYYGSLGLIRTIRNEVCHATAQVENHTLTGHLISGGSKPLLKYPNASPAAWISTAISSPCSSRAGRPTPNWAPAC